MRRSSSSSPRGARPPSTRSSPTRLCGGGGPRGGGPRGGRPASGAAGGRGGRAPRRAAANRGRCLLMGAPLTDFRLLDAYWRAANYLSVGQIYLLDNPLLDEPLA